MQKNPIQPLRRDKYRTLRFKRNILVEALLDHGQITGLGMNELAVKFRYEKHRDDWCQLAQLIGYSLFGYSDLSYVSDAAYRAAVNTIPPLPRAKMSKKPTKPSHKVIFGKDGPRVLWGRSEILPGTAAWRKFWRRTQWTASQLAALRREGKRALVFNTIQPILPVKGKPRSNTRRTRGLK